MTDVAEIVDAPSGASPKRGRRGLLLGLALALALAGGGFYGTRSGMVDPMAFMPNGEASGTSELDDVAFVALEPIMVSLPPGSSAKLLRFGGQLEVAPEHVADLTALMPRVLDVLNTYLRAVEVSDLEQPSALPRLRAQMLRRVQVVIGEERVRDLLVTEFVLN